MNGMCAKCGCQTDEDYKTFSFCEDCLLEWVEEIEE
jgi:hypothetical protein